MITNQISETSKPVCSSVLEMFLVGFFCVNWRRPGTSVCNVLAHWSLRTGALTLHIFLRETGQHNLLSLQTHFVREQILKVNNWENQFHISHSISQFADLLGVRRICTNVVADLGWVDLDFDVPLSHGFWLGWWELGKSGCAAGQDDGTSKSKSTQPRSATISPTLY